jgi:uncharacterized protein
MKNHPGSARSHGRETRVSATPQRFEIRKNSDGSRSISGTAVVFNSLSEDLGGFKERIAPGAFTQSLKDSPDVIIAYQHDLSQPLGRVSSGTAKVWQDSRGLQFSCTLPETTYASNLIALMERGDVSQMSFGFAVPPGGDEWTLQPDGTALRTVNTANLFECSVVTTPAYTATSVNLRSAPSHIKAQIKARRAADTSAQDAPSETDITDEFRCDCRCAACAGGACNRCTRGDCQEQCRAQHHSPSKFGGGSRSARDLDIDDDDTLIDDETDVDDDDELDCDCRCAECRNGDCDECSNAYCEDDDCEDCPVQQRSLHMDLILRRLR